MIGEWLLRIRLCRGLATYQLDYAAGLVIVLEAVNCFGICVEYANCTVDVALESVQIVLFGEVDFIRRDVGLR